MCLAERELDASGCRASGLTRVTGVPGHWYWLVPPPSAAVVVTKKNCGFTRAGNRIVQSTLLLSFFFGKHRRHKGADVYPTETSQ